MAKTQRVDIAVEGLNELMRAFRALPKEASKEMRQRAKVIAGNFMVPAWKDAAINYAGPWGFDLANAIKPRTDRIPGITVGNNKKTFRGGATTNMVRYPSHSGNRGNSWAPFEPTHWMDKVNYDRNAALQTWLSGLDNVVTYWRNYAGG